MTEKSYIESTEETRKELKEFMENVETLCKLTEEAFVTNKVVLLSPVLRELIAEKGKETHKQFVNLQHHIRIDKW